MIRLVLKLIQQEFSLCKVAGISEVDFSDEFCFLGKTDEEISLVCSPGRVPATTIARDDGWRAFRIEAVLDLSLIGILSQISRVLADAQIGIFALSTFNTDYILVKKESCERAISALKSAGHDVV